MTPALSLSEIEAIALKAARGAGMTWGLAEEAAFAARWLAERGIDGLTLLAHHLDRTPASPGTAPGFHAGCWTTGNLTRLCPIAAGAALSDHFHLPEGPLTAAVRLANLSAPALILPFLATAAARCDMGVVVLWDECRVDLSSGALRARGVTDGLMSGQAATVSVTATSATPAPDLANDPAPAAFLTISAATRQVLESLVHRTYVPASDQSRRGAGVAGMDNS